MQLPRKFQNLLSKRSRPDIYTSIAQLPIDNWMNVHKTGNLSYIYKLDNYDELPEQGEGLVEGWRVLYDEYLQEFGLGKEYETYLRKKHKIMVKKLDLIITGDDTIKTLIKVEEAGLAMMMDKKKPVKFIDVVASIEKYNGFQMDTSTLSTLKYYAYLRAIENAHRPRKK